MERAVLKDGEVAVLFFEIFSGLGMLTPAGISHSL